METAVLSTLLNMLGPKLYTFLQENHELRRNLEHDIRYIRNELRMIGAVIDEHERGQMNHGGPLQGAWIHGARELAYDMEDCIDRFMHRMTSGHRLATMAVRTKFATVIQKLRKKSEDLSKLRANYTTAGNGNGDCQASTSGTMSSFETTHIPTADTVPVGMDGPRDEILELIMETQSQPNQLKVISLVGFGGLGKTLLAKQIYENTTICTQFEPQAWVSAAGKSARDVLKEILCQLGFQSQAQEDDVSKLITSLKKCLHSKRFFIVIDDIQREYWNSTIKDAFPVDTGSSSIVLVTTAIHSIANACSSDYFNELINRSIIQPVATSSNTEVKTCQTHGMMLEFILHKSMCDDFITLLYDQACLPDKIRCLTVQHNSTRRGRMNSDIDLSHVRSLTIFGEAEDSVLEFSSYELLRVLDLEECENLKDEHLRKICKLLLLRDVLAALSNVRCLHYLKLITPNLEKFVIGQGPLKSLRRLCIMVQTMTEPEIQQGALPNLESFRLLCKDLNGLCGINIQYIGPECLKEVALDKRISEETKKKWKETVKNHPRWPKVSFVNTGEVGQMQNMEVAQPTEDAAALALAAGSLRPVPVFRRPKADQERTLDLCSMGQTSRESCSNTEPYFKTNGTSPGKLNPVNDECHHFC
nr:disease resistance protein RGA4 [Oryza sativa Japonica Group]